MAWSKRHRLEATIHGERADRPPVALWRHFPGDDQDADELALSQVEFQSAFDFDFMKVTPASSYCVEDWGVTSQYDGNGEGTRLYLERRIRKPDDWYILPRLDPQAGSLGRQLLCLRRIRQLVGEEVPFIQTIFSPLAQARYLAGDALLIRHLRRYPEALLAGLRVITDSIIAFVREVCDTGAAGIFFAVQNASYAILTEEEYRRFGFPFDQEVFEALDRRAWFNVLHLHGQDVMFDLLKGYPVQAINWHDRETDPSLRQALQLSEKVLIGGLRQWDTMVRGTPVDVRAEIEDALRQTGGRRYIVGTGCVTPIVAPLGNLRAARQAVERGI